MAIAAWYCEAKTQAQIAEDLAAQRIYRVSRQTISNDIKEIQRRWLESSIRDFDEARAEELAKIDHLEATAWDEYYRSRKAQKKTLQKSMSGDREINEARVEEIERIGDVRYLQLVDRCIERRCKLLGLDAPAKADITSGGAPLNIVEVAYTAGETL
jgi:hypothetical protein